MTRRLCSIGTLALALAAIAAATVPDRDPDRDARSTRRGEVRDQRRQPRSYCDGCERTPAGRIRRSEAARRQFRQTHPCPITGEISGPCPGYEIDHVIPLHFGGVDAPSNMQWLTHAQHQAKTASER